MVEYILANSVTMILVHSGTILSLLLASVLSGVHGFAIVQQRTSSFSSSARSLRRRPYLSSMLLHAAPNDDDDGDEDDDEEGDLDSSLGDWRKFRAALIDGGLPGEQETTSSNKDSKKERKAVAEKNEALLAKQNEKLAEEYRSGVWAHTLGQPEVGGLLCRMPLEAELYLGKSGGFWKEKLDVMLSLESDSEKNVDDKNVVSDANILARVDR